MRLDPVRAAGAVLALALLAAVVQQTVEAVGSSGVWTPRRTASAAPDPYQPLDRLLVAEASRTRPPVARDPFTLGRAPAAPRTSPAAAANRPARAPSPPVLTAIFWDDDPRALLSWNGTTYPVRTDSVVGGFRVARITASQVVLERGTETLVLTVRP